jgi:hypothetical protein
MNDDEQRTSRAGACIKQSHWDVFGNNRSLAGARSYRTVGRIEALFASEHIPRFRTRMQMHPVLVPGGITTYQS